MLVQSLLHFFYLFGIPVLEVPVAGSNRPKVNLRWGGAREHFDRDFLLAIWMLSGSRLGFLERFEEVIPTLSHVTRVNDAGPRQSHRELHGLCAIDVASFELRAKLKNSTGRCAQ